MSVLATSLNYVDYYPSSQIKCLRFRTAFELGKSKTSEQNITLPRIDFGFEILADWKVNLLEYCKIAAKSLRVKISFLMILLFILLSDWNVDLSSGTHCFQQ